MDQLLLIARKRSHVIEDLIAAGGRERGDLAVMLERQKIAARFERSANILHSFGGWQHGNMLRRLRWLVQTHHLVMHLHQLYPYFGTHRGQFPILCGQIPHIVKGLSSH
jgi:hypothetical protein